MNYINASLIVLEVVIIFFMLYKVTNKKGTDILNYILVISVILSNLFLVKRIEIFTLDINLGIVLNLTIYIIANIMIQRKGPESIKPILLKVIVTNIFSYILLIFSSLMISNNYNLTTNLAYSNLFFNNIRFYIASIITFLVCLPLSANIYYLVKKEKNKVWISNFLTIIITQFFEALLFIIIGYLFNAEALEIIFLIVSRYILRIIIGLLSIIIIVPISKIDE